jgi:conjugal transfer pilus assembly protein TraK
MSRLAGESTRLKSLKFNEQELEVAEDKAGGQFFVMPKEGVRKPINVFVTTEQGATVALILEPRDVPLQTVLIRELATETTASAPTRKLAPLGSASSSGNAARGNDVENLARRWIYAMYRGERLADCRMEQVNREVGLWAEVNFQLRSRCVGPKTTAEKYHLMNVTKGNLRLAEQEFFQPGVVAVSIELHELEPGKGTELVVLRETGGK